MKRTVLVTGASSGIGRAICERLLARGDRVIGIARDFGKFSEDRLEAHNIDLGDLNTLPDRLVKLAQQYPDLDAIICNAGQGRFAELEQFSYEQIRSQIDLNFTSHAFMVRTFLPLLKHSGQGDLVFMGSESALRGGPKGSVYCASKFALRGFAQSLRQECAKSSVRVCIINPGMVTTPFFEGQEFGPGGDEANFVLPEDVAVAVMLALDARQGTVFDEIELSPLKKVVERKEKKQEVRE